MSSKHIEIYRSFHLKLDSGVSCQSRIADPSWNGQQKYQVFCSLNPTLQECGDIVYWDNPIPAYTWQYCNYEPL